MQNSDLKHFTVFLIVGYIDISSFIFGQLGNFSSCSHPIKCKKTRNRKITTAIITHPKASWAPHPALSHANLIWFYWWTRWVLLLWMNHSLRVLAQFHYQTSDFITVNANVWESRCWQFLRWSQRPRVICSFESPNLFHSLRLTAKLGCKVTDRGKTCMQYVKSWLKPYVHGSFI